MAELIIFVVLVGAALFGLWLIWVDNHQGPDNDGFPGS